jgi:hypothetical protein
MQTIDGSLEERVRAGDITFEMAMQYAQSKENFSKLVNSRLGPRQPLPAPAAALGAGPPAPGCAEAVMSNAPGHEPRDRRPEPKVRVNDRIGRFLQADEGLGGERPAPLGRAATLFRVDGVISEVRYRSLTDGDFRTLIEPITPPHLWNQYERTGDVDFAYDLPGVSRYRVNLFRQQRGMGAVFRNLSASLVSIDR